MRRRAHEFKGAFLRRRRAQGFGEELGLEVGRTIVVGAHYKQGSIAR